MRMTIILASICAFLVSCATFTGGDTPAEQPTPESAAAPALDGAPAPMGDVASAPSPDIGDSGQASMEAQAAEQQTAQVDTMNEQRSHNELDAAAPEGSAAGTDSFYASSQPATPPEVEQVPESSPMPSELPQKQAASWDQHTDSSPSYQEEEKPVAPKKSKKIAKKKHDKKKIAKHSKKSKREIANKHSKKSKKIAKKSKSKVDCKKVAKHTKKSSKREIAMCKAEIKKFAKHSKKSHKTGKVAQAGCQCNYR